MKSTTLLDCFLLVLGLLGLVMIVIGWKRSDKVLLVLIGLSCIGMVTLAGLQLFGIIR